MLPSQFRVVRPEESWPRSGDPGLFKFTDNRVLFESVADARERVCASRIEERVFVPAAGLRRG